MELCLGTSLADFFLANFEFGGGWEELITSGRIRKASEAYKTSLWCSVPNHTSPLNDENSEALLKEFSHSVLRKPGPKGRLLASLGIVQAQRTEHGSTAMIVAASVLNTSCPALHILGTRHEVSYKLELDQASLLSLELDLWRGEEDCLHRAGKCLIMFMWEELKDIHPDSTSPLLATDTVGNSFKRLVTQFCVSDNQLSMTLSVRALMFLYDYRSSLPQPRDLCGMAMTKVSFHLIGGLITEYHLSAQPPNAVAQGRGEECGLDIFDSHICAFNIGSFIVSYLTMMLNASSKDIKILAGKAGEQRSCDMYQINKDWPRTTEVRVVNWHAGQVLRLFQCFLRTRSFRVSMAGFRRAQSDSILCLNDAASSNVEDDLRYLLVVILNTSCNCEGLSPSFVDGLVKLLKDLASAIRLSRATTFYRGLSLG
ncbi:hypothetical protein BDW68DRAFT_184954 [Aspergillus falconensis]